ncbi:papain-like cysteine protease family protein [Kineococcus rhizosphaerae]|uniref:Papain like cysteine protease AvrRpt2 n=1 Tax=Kineococcus rhizosphaerae TaxID=559628 RepID=A0A2T0QN95_9ACTN|nr:papain-like cysteine protease family protein [Kineococcus rhizosphaerae]PRY06015.1 papain like cysteine protease AvrRpt2 [Kineococcus rhizosphaerae]
MRFQSRVALFIALLTAFLGAGVVGAQAASRMNAAAIYVQEQSNWCWSATSRTIAQHVGANAASQCQFVKWGKNRGDCPDVTGAFTTDVSRALTMAGVHGIGYVYTYPESYAQLQDEMNLNRLNMIRFQWSNGSGHMLIVRGYDTNGSVVSFIDPTLNSFQFQSYSWMVNGTGHTWTHTRYAIT